MDSFFVSPFKFSVLDSCIIKLCYCIHILVLLCFGELGFLLLWFPVLCLFSEVYIIIQSCYQGGRRLVAKPPQKPISMLQSLILKGTDQLIQPVLLSVDFVSVDSTSVCLLSCLLCPTLCNTMDCRLPRSSVHGILQARLLEWVAMPSSRGTSQLRDQTGLSYVSCRWVLYQKCHLGSLDSTHQRS